MTDLERRALDHMMKAWTYPSVTNNQRLKKYARQLIDERQNDKTKP